MMFHQVVPDACVFGKLSEPGNPLIRHAWLGHGLVLLALFAATQVALYPQELLISEFLAANNSGLRDEDGDFSDWIEIYNPGKQTVSLEGWHLSDDPQDLTKWRFPAIQIPGQRFVLVFASDKDRSNPDGELHTNFKLSRQGEFLALTHPDEQTVVSEFSPSYPRQLPDVSYGIGMVGETQLLIPAGATGRLSVPSDGRYGEAWTGPGFDDSSWISVTTGIGYAKEEPDASRPEDDLRLLEDISQPDDRIEPTSSNSPVNEEVEKAIDDNARTKYLNFDKLNAGFTIVPEAGPTVVSGLRFTSANDAPDRDPTSFILSGSNDGNTFTEIARGGIPNFTSRFMTVEASFSNESAFTSYRLIFPRVRNAPAAVAVQIAEVEFMGHIGQPPPDFEELISTPIDSLMEGRNASVYLRIPFRLDEISNLDLLELRIRYEDGFVAYLNGIRIIGANAPDELHFNTAAPADRSRGEASELVVFNFDEFAEHLLSGTNLLAFHGLNDRTGSTDFLLSPELINTRIDVGLDGYFESATPGHVNATNQLGIVGDLTYDIPRGFYERPIEVAVSCATEGAIIRYTTDGSVPTTTSGSAYKGPIHVGRTTVLRAVGFREDWRPSRTATRSYLFLDDIIEQNRATALAKGFPGSWTDYELDPRVVGQDGTDRYGGKYARTITADLQTLPSLSIVMPIEDLFGPQGIYANPERRGDAWERATSVELMFPDQREGFQEDAGIRIQGGAFRRFDLTDKKSFRLVFRDEYGATTLRYPLFGSDASDSLDNIVLRGNSNDAWPWGGANALYIRDAFAMETALDMGMVAPHNMFVHLYLNGLYWGLYNPVERPDAGFSAAYHGGDRDTWDAINQDSVPDGNYDAWNRMLAMLNRGLAENIDYQRIQGNNPDGTRNPEYEDLLDMENMIDYMILNFYVGNVDWPHRNFWVGRDRDDGAGFQFYPWDTETALGLGSGVNNDRTGVNGAVARPYTAARANADFRMLFADRAYRHFFNGGAFFVNPNAPQWDPDFPENNRPAARFVEMADSVDRAMVAESARWGDQKNASPYTRDTHWERARDDLLNNYFPRRSAVVLDQFRNAGLYPRTEAPVFNHPSGPVAQGFKLMLSAPRGTIYFSRDGIDPLTPVTIEERARTVLVAGDTPKKVMVPSPQNGGYKLGSDWRDGESEFDDSGWISGKGGVGYDTGAEYRNLISINVDSSMRGKNGSAYIRIPFQYSGPDTASLNFMALRMRYDDGFAAYLNGEAIASANAPENLQWSSFAAAQNADSAAMFFREFEVTEFLPVLRAGENLLAIHGLNLSLSSSDFLIDAELIVGQRTITGGEISAQTYTEPIELQDLTTLKTRALYEGEWSALNEATFTVGSPSLILTEMHYHPAASSEEEIAAGFDIADDFEFVELLNHGNTTFDLRGVRFIDGIQFDFMDSSVTVLPPGQYLLVVKNRDAFVVRYGEGLPIAGEYSGRLSNNGERVELADAHGASILVIDYGTNTPWPETADGDGPSLVVVDPGAELSAPENWRISRQIGGSPGRSESSSSITIESLVLEENELRLVFQARQGLAYTIYFRESLSTGTWQPLTEIETITADGPVEIPIEMRDGARSCFFQIATD